MAKGAVVRGTPVNFIPTGGTRNEGIAPSTPKGFKGGAGTVAASFEHQDQVPGHGTPYQSGAGNSDEFMREVSHGPKGGIVLSENGINMNEPRDNGNGVILDGVRRDNSYNKIDAPALDSPVPHGAPAFDGAAMVAENRAHLGSGNEAAAGDVLLGIGGVMSRGMVGTSTPQGGPDELLEDDVLRNLGPGGAAG